MDKSVANTTFKPEQKDRYRLECGILFCRFAKNGRIYRHVRSEINELAYWKPVESA